MKVLGKAIAILGTVVGLGIASTAVVASADNRVYSGLFCESQTQVNVREAAGGTRLMTLNDYGFASFVNPSVHILDVSCPMVDASTRSCNYPATLKHDAWAEVWINDQDRYEYAQCRVIQNIFPNGSTSWGPYAYDLDWGRETWATGNMRIVPLLPAPTLAGKTVMNVHCRLPGHSTIIGYKTKQRCR